MATVGTNHSTLTTITCNGKTYFTKSSTSGATISKADKRTVNNSWCFIMSNAFI